MSIPSAALWVFRQEHLRLRQNGSGSFMFKTGEGLIIGKKLNSSDFSLPGDERLILVFCQKISDPLSCAWFFCEIIFIFDPEAGQEIGN